MALKDWENTHSSNYEIVYKNIKDEDHPKGNAIKYLSLQNDFRDKWILWRVTFNRKEIKTKVFTSKEKAKSFLKKYMKKH